jgi:hypothetical protein
MTGKTTTLLNSEPWRVSAPWRNRPRGSRPAHRGGADHGDYYHLAIGRECYAMHVVYMPGEGTDDRAVRLH